MFKTVDDLRNCKAIITDFWDSYAQIGDFYTVDVLIVSSVLNRALEINNAFNELTKDGSFNYIAAVPLVRLQLDNVLYSYAGAFVDDLNDFIHCFLSGQNWNRLKDREGNDLTEKYLVEKLCEYFNSDEVRRVYKECSNYIHFSSSHIH